MKNATVVRYHSDRGTINLLVFKEGHKFLRAVEIGAPVHVVKIPLTEKKHMTTLSRKGAPYPADRCARKMLAAGKALGITKSASVILRSVKEQK